jgi:RNA polymerase sigma-70 factor, ECF subfamily
MQRYQAGDAQAANELVEHLYPVLARFFRAMAPDTNHLDDLLQDCWLRIHRARHSYRHGEPVLPWIFAIARHTRVDQYRRLQRTQGRESSIEQMPELQMLRDPQDAWDGSITAQKILRALDSLPAAQKEVLIMLKIAGMSLEEVGLATGSSPNAVKQKAFRAYRSIRQALGAPDKKEQARGI